jgi:NDP-sugar pyrophosphorylase family protein
MPEKAVILAAGRGTRMGAMTEEIPKPMLEIRGRPMLAHVLDNLRAAGLAKFLIVTGYHAETIETYFSALPDVEFLRQSPVDGTGSATLLAEPFAANESFLLTYGDILCDPVEYQRAISIEADAVVAVKAVDDPWQGAAVYEEAGRITRIIEKPPKGTSTTAWNSAGFYIFRPVVFDYVRRIERSPRGEYELPSALEGMLRDGLDLRISAIEGAWRDVGRPEDLAAMNR